MATPTQKKTKEMLMNMEISAMMHMPDDIIAEILPWLPAKSLIRFKWLCKYWFDLITRDDDFIKKHLFRSNLCSSSRLWGSDYNKFSVSLSGGMFTKCYIDYTTGRFSRQLTIPITYFVKSSCCRFLGSCHGLILFASSYSSKFRILNPCTKEYKVIARAPICFDEFPYYRSGYYNYGFGYDRTCYKSGYYNYGFGYDRTTDDYKVIRVAYPYSDVDGNDENISHFLYVYTLGTNSWRSIGSIPYTLLPHIDKSGVFVNGALYWRNYSKTKIISFDMGKESFEEITNEPVFFHDNLKNGRLGMFEGSLSVILLIDDPITGASYVEMWVMKEDNYIVNNNESSWTKLFRTKPSLACSFMFLKPLRFTKSGEIVLMNKWGSLLSYDPKNPTATLVALKRTWGKEEHRTVLVENENIVYIESLVSLNSGTYAAEKQNKLSKGDRIDVSSRKKEQIINDEDQIDISLMCTRISYPDTIATLLGDE